MYDVIVIFEKNLSRADRKTLRDLTGLKTILKIDLDLTEVLQFCQIALGVEKYGNATAYELKQCKSLTLLMLSPMRPFYCVRKDDVVLDVTSMLGQILSMSQYALQSLLTVQRVTARCNTARQSLEMDVNPEMIEEIENKTIPAFRQDLDGLIERSRRLYASSAHREE
jgi:hypothetical protein